MKKEKIYLLFFFNTIAFLTLASEVNVKIVAYDSLNHNRILGYFVHVNFKDPVYYSGDSSHCVNIKLNCRPSDTEFHHISIVRHNYLNKVILLDSESLCKRSKDTVIVVKMAYDFHPVIIPVFFFNKYEYVLDDIDNYVDEINRLVYIINLREGLREGLVFTIDGYYDIDEMKDECIDLAYKRAVYIRDLLIRKGADCRRIETKKVGYKPFIIYHTDYINGPFGFRDTINQSYINNISKENRDQAQRYNRRVGISIRTQ